MSRKLLAAVLLFSAFSPTAVADWLVMRDGGRVETDGPWRIKGSLVIFTLPGGALSSIRSSEVDLVASQAANAELAAPRRARLRPLPPRQPILALTDADIPPADRASPWPDKAADPASPGVGSELEVDFWAEVEKAGGLEILGRIRNRGQRVERVYGVVVDLGDGEGEILQSVRVVPKDVVVPPGEKTDFRAYFPGVGEDHGRPSFRIETEPGISARDF